MKTKFTIPGFMIVMLLLTAGPEMWAQTNSSPSQTVCTGNEPYLVTATIGSTFTWSISPGTTGSDWRINGTGNSITVDWNKAGVYTLSVSERNAAGCDGSPKQVVVTVIPAITVDPVANAVYCNGVLTTAITFTSQTSGTTFTWTNSNTAIGLGASGTGALPSFSAINTGTTPVVATITVTPSSVTCGGTPLTFTITVNPVPAPSIIGTNPAVCQSVNGSTETYRTANVPGNTYNWNVTGGTFTGQGTNQIVVTWTTAGPGSISVTETVGSIGCSASDNKVINIQAAPNTSPIFHN